MVNNTQYLTGGKSLNPLSPPTNLASKAGNAQVTLTWIDPPNATVEPSGQTYATWAYTQVVRKEGSQPTGPHDGIVVVQSSVRDQYATSGFVDTGLTNDTLYYYGAFAYNSDGVYSEGAFVSATPQVGTPLSELTEGTLITINENGAPIEFYVAKQNYEPDLNGEGRTLMVRKNVSYSGYFNPINVGNCYNGSSIDSYINGTYKALFNDYLQNLMGTTTFTCITGNKSSAPYTLTRSCFILSATELGAIPSSNLRVEVEGTVLPVASNILLTQNESGTTISYYTRSPWSPSNTKDYACYVTGESFAMAYTYSTKAYYRPCFTLPSTAYVDSNNALIET